MRMKQKVLARQKYGVLSRKQTDGVLSSKKVQYTQNTTSASGSPLVETEYKTLSIKKNAKPALGSPLAAMEDKKQTNKQTNKHTNKQTKIGMGPLRLGAHRSTLLRVQNQTASKRMLNPHM